MSEQVFYDINSDEVLIVLENLHYQHFAAKAIRKSQIENDDFIEMTIETFYELIPIKTEIINDGKTIKRTITINNQYFQVNLNNP